ncbi:MAG: CvpA family protein [Lachnospiraceae bacterium]|nr:CvpA family protein [Lachnospiraceae bacterium]
MTIDWLLILVIVILVIFTYYSYHRGFVKSALSMVLYIITIILVNFINPYVTEYIMEETPFYENIKESCMEIYSPDNQEEISTNGSDEDIINSYPIAGILKEQIIKDNTPEVYQLLNVDAIEEYIAAYIAKTIVSAASFVISFIIVWLALKLLMTTLNVLTKLPVIKEINKTVGGLLGFVQGLIIVWILFIAAEIFNTTAFGISVQEQISGNIILRYISDHNIIWNLIMK